MRILLTHHLPLEGSRSGQCARDLAAGLAAAGHEVLCLMVEGRRVPESPAYPFAVESIRCGPGDPEADLAFDMPSLEPHPVARLRFDDLNDLQLVEYRNALRRRLDRCVERFDPHIIHCQHAWLFGHLALESGAPYVITAHGLDLRAAHGGPRYRRLVEQALENAASILVYEDAVAKEAAALFPEIQGRIEQVAAPTSGDNAAASIRKHLACYESGLNRRYGDGGWQK